MLIIYDVLTRQGQGFPGGEGRKGGWSGLSSRESGLTSPPSTSTRHSSPMQTPRIGILPIPQVITSRLIPLSVFGCPGPGLMITRSRSPASNISYQYRQHGSHPMNGTRATRSDLT